MGKKYAGADIPDKELKKGDHPYGGNPAPKEQQPSRAEDLSKLHRSKEVGTAGADQRSKVKDPENENAGENNKLKSKQ